MNNLDKINAVSEAEFERGIFGSFFLNQSEFSISVTYIQEVVNPPLKYTSVPLSPAYLVGLFNLRGLIIPVVDLRVLLKTPEASVSLNEQKIAIVEFGNCCIGLLFDRTGEIFKSHDEERSNFEKKSADNLIAGVFKKDDGKRIVQIINVQALFELQNIPQQNELKQQRGRGHLSRQRGLRKQCISFLVGPSKCALGIEEIQEILKIEKINESALSINQCIGTIDLRGTTVPILDFASLLGYRETDRSSLALSGDRRIVVMRVEQELFGLMVDSVDSIVSYFPDELLSFPLLNRERSEMFFGCISLSDGHDILLMNHAKILSNSEIHEVTHGHSKIYRASTDKAKDAFKKQGGLRKTYITFSVENTYAIRIEETKEIIDYPSVLMQLPGLPEHFKGVLNLRGELVTIIDARAMYAKEEKQDKSMQKVLVFKRDNVHFGLVVDSIEAIISFSENEKIKIPDILYQQNVGGLSDDVVEAVEINNGHDKKQSLMILNVESIANRVSKSA